MWYDRKRRHVTETTPESEHWPTERMIQEGHADYATPEDLEGLTDERLVEIAEICRVTTAAPDECIPCLAYATYMDRQKAKLEDMVHTIPGNLDRDEPTPKLDALMAEEPQWVDPPSDTVTNITNVPVAERFASHVRVLALLVEEMLEGPPIPPPNVTEAELALLVVGAQRWIRVTEAQGVDLAPEQQKVLDAMKTLVARLHRG
jgi:hypothetical protein